MTELKEFKLPDVGEGLTEADIVAWHVKPGDQVEVNQIIVEIETAKAVVELPSPWDGTVARLLAEEGQTVDVGTPIIAVDVSGTGPAVATENDSAERSVVPAPAPAATPPAGEAKPERQAVLVGYGVKAAPTTRRARRVTPAAPAAAAAEPAVAAESALVRPETAEVPAGTQVPAEPPELPAEPAVPAAPAAPAAAAAEPAVAAEPAPRPGRWPSRRCAGWPRISASTWPS